MSPVRLVAMELTNQQWAYTVSSVFILNVDVVPARGWRIAVACEVGATSQQDTKPHFAFATAFKRLYASCIAISPV